MAIPQEPTPPPIVGSQPRNADEVNGLTGLHLRNFMASRMTIEQDESFFLGTDLKAAPYFFSGDQETLIKSAYTDLNTALQAIDLTFISKLIGMA